MALLLLGMLMLAAEDYAAAGRLLQESADLYEEIGERNDRCIAIAALGLVARALGNPAQAQKHLCQALQTEVEIHGSAIHVMAIPATALLLADAGHKERAVEIYALASRYPFVSKSRFYEDIIGRHIAAAAAALPPEVSAAARERGRARDLWETAEELLAELKNLEWGD
jgi:hypothetical protein